MALGTKGGIRELCDRREAQAFRPAWRFLGLRGNRRLLGDQESVGCDTQGAMMVETGPSSALIVAEPEFLLEFLVVPFDQPAQLGEIDEPFNRSVGGQVGKPEPCRLGFVIGAHGE